MQGMVDAVVDTYGRLDCAFNNAGKLTSHKRGWTETPVEFFDEMINTNLRGVWLCMKHELRVMVRQGFGSIVNNSSIGGIRGGGGEIYIASKHGVVGLTRNAALTYGPVGIRVNAIGPGIVATETYLGNLSANPEMGARTGSRYSPGQGRHDRGGRRGRGMALVRRFIVRHGRDAAGGWRIVRNGLGPLGCFSA